jgi:hypothetical protein
VLPPAAYNSGVPNRVQLIAIGCAPALAACGSSSKPSATGGSSNHAAFLKFSECMRSHGVPNFPDPTFGKGGERAFPSDVNPKSPTFQSAMKACGGGAQIAVAP